jgi:hypothetical protein
MKRRDLIVPIRDRRAHKRILTLKNGGKALLALLVVFIGLTIFANMHHARPGEFGRLFSRRIAEPEVTSTRHVEVVTEAAPIADQTSVDPLLIAPSAREQTYGINQPPSPSAAVAAPHATAAAAIPATGDHVAIVGDERGVSVVRSNQPSGPKLSGGFGKPQ